MISPKKNIVTKVAGAAIKAVKGKKPSQSYAIAKELSAKKTTRALKAAQGKSLAPKGYKPDTEGRKQVKRFAAPLEKYNGKKTSMRMGAQAVEAGRSMLKIKAAPKNRGK